MTMDLIKSLQILMKSSNQMKHSGTKNQERLKSQKRRQYIIKKRSRTEFLHSDSTGMITIKSLEKTNSTAISPQQTLNNTMVYTTSQRLQEQSQLTNIWQIFKKTITKIFLLKEVPSIRAYLILQRRESTSQFSSSQDLFFKLLTIVFLQISLEIKLLRLILLKFL